MTERKSYQTDYILSMSRIPVRFFPLIHGLTGRDATYQNPGISVQSFVVANGLRKEVIELEGQLVESFKICEHFSMDKEVLSRINESLIQSAATLLDQMNTLPQDLRFKMLSMAHSLHENGKMIQMSFDSLLESQNGNGDVNIMSIPGVTYKQAIFDMQDKIEEVIQMLDESTPDSVA